MINNYFKKACFLLALMFGVGSQAATVYVDQASTGIPDGLTWGTAWLDVQTALASASAGDEIWVAQGTYFADPTIQSVSFHLNGSADIAGIYGGFDASALPSSICDADPSAYPTILSGEINGAGITDNTERIILVTPLAADLVIQGLHIQYGYADGGGAANSGAGVHYEGGSTFTLSINACEFLKNTASSFGGAIYTGANGVISLNIGCGLENTVIYNQANRGGGMYTQTGATVSVQSSYFGFNNANRGGGIFYRSTANTIESGLIFEQNTSALEGGAIFENVCSTVSSANCVFVDNVAGSNGGAVYTRNSGRSISSSDLKQNSAFSGGAIAVVNGSFTSGGSTVNYIDNVATFNGGALYIEAVGTASLDLGNYSGNTASNAGGGIFASASSDVDVIGSDFDNNSATYGGGISMDNADLDVNSSTLSNNQAQDGGGIYVSQGAMNVNTASTLEYNDASDNGGAIYMADFSGASVDDATFIQNTASSGGAIYGFNMDGQVSSSSFGTDYASFRGGAIALKTVTQFDIISCAFDNSNTDLSASGGKGGAIYAQGSNVYTAQTIYQGCSSPEGGVAGLESSQWHSDDCIFDQNFAPVYGGVFHAEASELEIENDEFTENSANEAGAIFVMDGCQVFIRNSLAFGNTANGNGGFMINQHSSDVYVGNFMAIANTSSAEGGVFSSESTDANYFIANMMGTCNYASQSNIYNSTSGGENFRMYFSSFTNNTHPDGLSFTTGRSVMQNSFSSIIANSIFWQNQDHTFCGGATVEYTDTDGGYDCSGFVALPWPGAGNVNINPEFLDVDGLDNALCTGDDELRLNGPSSLGTDSPCLDIGSGAASHHPSDFADVDDDGDFVELLPIDILGANRIYNVIPDMGAYENDGTYKNAGVPAIYAQEGDMHVFPNPATDVLNVISGSDILGAQVFNLNGQLMEAYANLSSGQAQIDLSQLSPGVYILRVTDASGESTKQIEKF